MLWHLSGFQRCPFCQCPSNVYHCNSLYKKRPCLTHCKWQPIPIWWHQLTTYKVQTRADFVCLVIIKKLPSILISVAFYCNNTDNHFKAIFSQHRLELNNKCGGLVYVLFKSSSASNIKRNLTGRYWEESDIKWNWQKKSCCNSAVDNKRKEIAVWNRH